METFGRVGNCRRALSYPPHVTLRTGALVPDDEVETWLDAFGRHIAGWETPVPIRTAGYVYEPYEAEGVEKHFFGYRVAETPELLAFHEYLCRFTPHIKSPGAGFRPHLSLAYDDVGEVGAARLHELVRRSPQLVAADYAWTCRSVDVYHRLADRWVQRAVLEVANTD